MELASSDVSARHTCHCGKSFLRKEHLTRHQNVHDRAAFICDVCQRTFSRAELLRRHKDVHDPARTRTSVSCDACRALKSKCSGGARCRLCTRRGINCTFRTSLGRPARDTIDNSTPTVKRTMRNGDSCRSSTNPSAENVRIAEEISGPSWFRTLSVTHSRPASRAGRCSLFAPGIQAVHELLRAEEPSLKGAVECSDGFQEWLIECREAYFETPHLRWPILNASSFDLAQAYLPLAAMVCVIGVGMKDDVEAMERLRCLQVHDLLLQRLLHTLIEPEMTVECQAWPIQHLQAVLLTLIFSLHRIDKHATSRAVLLRGTFIALLRQLRMFDAETLAGHLQTHFSCTFAPYRLNIREQFMRFLNSVYQFDVYFGMAHGMPPLLQCQEIGANLPTTFALWNAHGLDVLAKRLLEEPSGRASILVSAMAEDPRSLALSPLLVEDVLLGLCSVFQRLWVLTPSSRKEDSTDASQRAKRIEKLEAWKQELDKIRVLVDTRLLVDDTAREFRMAYRGRDESVAEALKRINALIEDGLALYHSLKIHHYSSLVTSDLVARADCRTKIWHPTKHGRAALACALQMLLSLDSTGVSDASIHPLIRSTHSMGATLFQRVLLACENCEFLGDERQHTCEVGLQQWLEIGGSFCVDGTPLCVCALGSWSERFDNAIRERKLCVDGNDLYAQGVVQA